MKRTLLVVGLAILMSLFSASAYAQPAQPAHEGHGQPSTGAHEQHSVSSHGAHEQHSMHPGKGVPLTPDQKARVQELRRKFIGENAQLIGALVARKLEFHSLWSDPKSDPKAIMDKGSELASIHTQLKEKVLKVMVDARSFLTPEQITHVKRHWFSHNRMMGRHGMMGRHRTMRHQTGMMGHGGMMGQQGGGMMGHGGMMGGGMSGHGGGMKCPCGMMGGGGMSDRGMSGHGTGETKPPTKY